MRFAGDIVAEVPKWLISKHTLCKISEIHTYSYTYSYIDVVCS